MDNRRIVPYTINGATQRNGGVDDVAGERKFVWFNTNTEKELYDEARSMQFSTEVKKWLRYRIQRKQEAVDNGGIAVRDISIGSNRREIGER